jgi:hypothetical protein
VALAQLARMEPARGWPTDAVKAAGFCGSRIEMEILFSKTGSAFSYSLGHGLPSQLTGL